MVRIRIQGLTLNGGNGNGYQAASWQAASWQNGYEYECDYEWQQQTYGTNTNTRFHGHQYSQEQKQSPAQNPLDEFWGAQAKTMPVMEQLQYLNQMCAALKSVFEEDERKKVEMQSCLQAKM